MHECYYGIVAVNAHCRHRRSSLNPFFSVSVESSGKKQKKILSLPCAAQEEASLSSRQYANENHFVSFFSGTLIVILLFVSFSFLSRKIISRGRRKIKNPDWWELFLLFVMSWVCISCLILFRNHLMDAFFARGIGFFSRA